MTFGYTESEQIVHDLSERLFKQGCPIDRLDAVEAGPSLIDEKLLATCASSGLVGLCLPGDAGGDGLGFTELVVILEQQGRFVAPIPLAPTVVSALAVAQFGSQQVRGDILPGVVDGGVVLTSALSSVTTGLSVRAEHIAGDWHLDGRELAVPAATRAKWLLVPAASAAGETGLYIVAADAPGIDIEPAATTNRQAHGHVSFTGARARWLGDEGAVEWLRQRMTVALCAVQCGLARGAIELTGQYVSTRKQFGKPLSYFQAVLVRLADAVIAAEMLQTATYSAAASIAAGHDAAAPAAIAKWWASDRGPRIAEAALHLHGGAGNVLDYPLARYYLWAKQIDVALGGAAYQLARLGQWLAEADGPVGTNATL